MPPLGPLVLLAAALLALAVGGTSANLPAPLADATEVPIPSLLQMATDEVGHSSTDCTDQLNDYCDGARHASVGNCLVWVGQHAWCYLLNILFVSTFSLLY
jgi:hypothetical protein